MNELEKLREEIQDSIIRHKEMEIYHRERANSYIAEFRETMNRAREIERAQQEQQQ